MDQIRGVLWRPLTVALAAVALAALGLVACGGSSGTPSAGSQKATVASAATGQADSKSQSGATNGNPGGPTGGTGPQGVFRDRGTRPAVGAFRECLRRNGVTLPSGPGGARGLFLGGANLPKGVTRAQLRAAMRACLPRGGFLARRAGAGPGARRFSSPRFRSALSDFAACLRQHGVNVPAPNTSGNGPVFSTKGLNTSSPQFRAATAQCRSALAAGLAGKR